MPHSYQAEMARCAAELDLRNEELHLSRNELGLCLSELDAAQCSTGRSTYEAYEARGAEPRGAHPHEAARELRRRHAASWTRPLGRSTRST